ncbi:hypothetical protein B0H67DRAFT_680122 [Lasiosphaeris hirsuta]|uniref:Uncharacterized protein n=1 Tax=Lasiosphaeris hirsuta TaxID=260670 RepID=A0AA40E5D3_9PEZI|nr:hypothetical protein B0H67DRAFT_680122 [Lasiosphaeris hirsuta]
MAAVTRRTFSGIVGGRNQDRSNPLPREQDAEWLRDIFPGETRYLREWYVPWILNKAASYSPTLGQVFPRTIPAQPSSSQSAPENRHSEDSAHVLGVLRNLAREIRSGPRVNLEAISSALEKKYVGESTIQQGVSGANLKLNMLFSLLAWLAPIYEPQPPSAQPVFRIAACDGSVATPYIYFSRPHTDASLNLPYFLKGFGMLLPSRQSDIPSSLSLPNHNAPSATTKGRSTQPLSPESFNMKLLSSLGHLKVEWTDTLSSHLHVDAESVQLYRFPSYCLASLPPDSVAPLATPPPRSVLHSCAAESSDAHWIQEWEVSEYLREVLLSYRLLFGQNKLSRDYFSKIKPAAPGAIGYDPLLDELCTSLGPVGDVADRRAYPLALNFPFLSSKLQELKSHLDAKRPGSWKDLWRDRRDSAQWLTFWTVLIFGACSVTLSVMANVLAGLQLWRAWG